MQARDVMTTSVATVAPDSTVAEIAKTLLERRISAVPVVAAGGELVGIVSEGDLMRRPETGTERHPGWWLQFLTLPDNDARRFIKTHGRHARDVMTRAVVTAAEDDSLEKIASMLEKGHIKRVPIMRDGRLVGVVSRADLLRGVAVCKPAPVPDQDDRSIHEAVKKAIREHTGLDDLFIGATVTGGVVYLWGGVEEPVHKDAARVAAENIPGVRAVEDHIKVFPPSVRASLWAS